MEQEELYILKRDGSRQLFEAEKIRSAIYKAYRAGGVRPDPSSVDVIVARIESVARAHKDGALAVEDIQDMVEQALMAADPFIAKKYIIYREWRTVERDKRTRLKHTMDGIVKIEKNDTNLSNVVCMFNSIAMNATPTTIQCKVFAQCLNQVYFLHVGINMFRVQTMVTVLDSSFVA